MATVGERIDSAIDTAGETAGKVGDLLSQQVDKLVTSAKDLTTPKPSLGRIVHYRMETGEIYPAIIVSVGVGEHWAQLFTCNGMLLAKLTAEPVAPSGSATGWFWPPRV